MIVCVINQKGGVGKTTTAINLAVGLAQWGQPTLLVDSDPQGNATSGLGARAGNPSLYEALVAGAEDDLAGEAEPANAAASLPPSPLRLRPAVSAGPLHNLHVVGASQELAGSEVDLAANQARDNLRRVLRALEVDYPVIIVDTPPSLSLITVNALVAADRLIIPVQCEYFALEGLGQLLRTLELIRRSLNPQLTVLGLLRTMYDSRLGLSAQVSGELERHFANLLFQTVIPRNVRLAEAPSHGLPVELYDRRSPGADAYRRLALEVMRRAGLDTVAGV
jgi:chromosome partitioning protein